MLDREDGEGQVRARALAGCCLFRVPAVPLSGREMDREGKQKRERQYTVLLGCSSFAQGRSNRARRPGAAAAGAEKRADGG